LYKLKTSKLKATYLACMSLHQRFEKTRKIALKRSLGRRKI